jgi:hypothetical protein
MMFPYNAWLNTGLVCVFQPWLLPLLAYHINAEMAERALKINSRK